jgi:hypothetical protein
MFPAERSKPASKLQSRPESSAIPSSKNDEGSEGESLLDAASNAESEEVFFLDDTSSDAGSSVLHVGSESDSEREAELT